MFKMCRGFAGCRLPFRSCRCRNNIYDCCYTRDMLNINEINYEELKTKMQEGAILIDVRTKQEFLEGHLDGAILIPYYDIYSKIQNIVPSKDQMIIVYCKNGGRSLRAYDILNQLGYNNIYDLKGGIEGV